MTKDKMIKVRFRECIAGANFAYKPYSDRFPFEYDLPKDLAAGYIKRGIAYVSGTLRMETAVDNPPIETQVKKPVARKGCKGCGKKRRTVNRGTQDSK